MNFCNLLIDQIGEFLNINRVRAETDEQGMSVEDKRALTVMEERSQLKEGHYEVPML